MEILKKMNDIVDKPPVDVFKEIYYQLKRKIQEDEDVMNRDLGGRFPKYLMQKIATGVLVNIAIRGEPGVGKSTVALEIMRLVNLLLCKYFNKEIDNYEQIASDDTEFIRMVKDDNRRQVCMTVDEYNPMGRTGANATTEIAEQEFFSDLCRVYYVHRIKCSPTKITDPNVELILDVIAKDEKKKRNHVKVWFRNIQEATNIELGVMWINVSKTLEADWHRKYIIKKEMRVDLLNKHAIRDVRELEQADIAKEIIDQMKPKLTFINKQDIAGLTRLKVVTLMKRKYKTILSWLAEDEILKPVRIILDAQISVNKIKNKEIRQMMNVEVSEAYGELDRKVAILKKYRGIV